MSPLRKVGRPPLSGESGRSAAQESQTTEPPVTTPDAAAEPAVSVEVEAPPLVTQDETPAEAAEVEVPEAEVESPVAVDIASDGEATAETSAIEADAEVDVDLADTENGEGRRSGLFGRLFSRKR